MPDPSPLTEPYTDGDAISPWDVEWCDAPGTATDADAITLDEWERRRAERAKRINPALRMETMPEPGWGNGRRRRQNHAT